MNSRWLISLVVWLLVAGHTGCGGAHRYDGRLVLADSLMQHSPDSALALVEAVSPDSLAAGGDRAYRDLLLTQARYKCYIAATSDSAINRALNYYRQHDDEREKLTRAYIYKGAVMEELGHPDSAMLYYKTAEATADTSDYANLGYVNLRIAKLYQRSRTNDSAVINRMTKAAHYYTILRDTAYLIVTVGTKGIYLYDNNKDSARIYLERVIALAQSIKSPQQFRYQSKLAGIYFYKAEYEEALRLSLDIINNGKEFCDEHQFYYYAARSFIKKSRLDSAYWVKSLIPAPINVVDSMNHYLLLAEIAEAESNLKEYSTYSTIAKQLNDKIYKSAINSTLSEEEQKISSHQQNIRYKTNLIKIVAWTLIVTIVIITSILLWIRKHMRTITINYKNNLEAACQELENTIKDFEAKMAQTDIEHEHLLASKVSELELANRKNQELLESKNDIHHQVSKIIRIRRDAIDELYQEIRVRKIDNNGEKKRKVPLISIIKELNDNKELLQIKPKESFWVKLELSIEHEYPGLLSFVKDNYPNLTQKDIQFFMMLCAHISPQIIKLCFNYDHVVTVSNYKRKLIKEKIGMNITFEELIKLYEEGKLS